MAIPNQIALHARAWHDALGDTTRGCGNGKRCLCNCRMRMHAHHPWHAIKIAQGACSNCVAAIGQLQIGMGAPICRVWFVSALAHSHHCSAAQCTVDLCMRGNKHNGHPILRNAKPQPTHFATHARTIRLHPDTCHAWGNGFATAIDDCNLRPNTWHNVVNLRSIIARL